MLKIGLTGGIASGKSQASQYFTQLGVSVIDADKIARDLFKPHSPLLSDLREHFGISIFDENGELDRKKLSNIVFNTPSELEWLNAFTHPLINQKMKEALASIESSYVILDIPLLISTNGGIPGHLKGLIDRVLVIAVTPEIQLKRVTNRDHIDNKSALKIIQQQSNWSQKLALADDVIDNNGDLIQLRKKVESMHHQFLQRCSNSNS